MYTIYMWAVLILMTTLYGSMLAVCLFFPWRDRAYVAVTRGWARSIARLAGVRITARGYDKLDPERPFVFMSNHQSYFDIIAITKIMRHRLRFVAKMELLFVPILGQVMWASGHILIARGKHENAVAGMKKAAEKIRSGTSILVFPEGTRSPDHKLGSFKKGGFILALEAGAPIVPVSISGTHPMMPKGGFSFTRSDVTIMVGEPIETAGLGADDAARQRLIEQTRAAIIANFPDGSAEAKANAIGSLS